MLRPLGLCSTDSELPQPGARTQWASYFGNYATPPCRVSSVFTRESLTDIKMAKNMEVKRRQLGGQPFTYDIGVIL
jgi:hypothetical protein